MADQSRIDDLRRRVQKDPASIAFAQLAEELRRAAQFEESIEICRAGLAIHPGYLSARVTLGRALVELNLLDDAQAELQHVLAGAPENLAAIRGLAEISHRKGNLPAALSHYRSALTLAKNDPDLQETVRDLSKKVEPPKPPASADGLSLEQVARELTLHRPPPATVAAPQSDFFATPASPDALVAASLAPPDVPAPLSEATRPVAADAFPSDFFATPASPEVRTPLSEAAPSAAADAFPSDFFATLESPVWPATVPEPPIVEPALLERIAPPVEEPELLESIEPPVVEPIDPAVDQPVETFEPALAEWIEPAAVGPVPQAAVESTAQEPLPLPHESLDTSPASSPDTRSPRGTRVVAALEQWLEAIHVAREQHGA
ncbi:MAG TPA: tetratricopeptide repeat protein [Vicinamibacterales bacterium]|nr:tetratricopeptide repeat protein [Vicinamibacterales bacterium]